MKEYSITEQRIVKNEQEFTLEQNFKVNSILLNGVLLEKDKDYSIKNDIISFTKSLSENDEVIFHNTVNTNKRLISPGKLSNSLYSRFTHNPTLNENNKYRIGIAIDKDIYEWEFNSRQNPMFTTAKKIYEDIGEFIDGFTEEYINAKIYDNSVAVMDLIDTLAAQETPVENVTYEQDDDGFYTTKYKAVNNWVRYKTDIDLTLARYFGISYHYGSELKNIGDIKIEKATKLPYIDNLLDMLRKQWDEADKVIRGTNVVASAIKAGTRYKYDDWNRDTTW